MTPQDISMLADAMKVMVTFGFMDGIAYTLAALKFCDLLLDFSDWLMPRVKRYLSRSA